MLGTLIVVAMAALAAGALVGWLLAAAREKARGETGLRAAEARLREIECGARAAQATVDELRAALSRGEVRERELARELAEAQKHRTVAETQVAELRRSLDEQKAILDSAEEKLGDTFRALAAEALAANNEGFLTLASEKFGAARRETDASLDSRHKAIEALLKPVRDSLEKVDGNIREIEKERGQAYGRLNALVTGLATSQDKLTQETGNLVRALRAPAVRGRWGEIQLQRVVELAGMVEHCDFVQQETLDDGRLRPDLIVNLPNGHQVVVDAKVPLEAYLAAVDAAADEPLRCEHLRRHADQVRAHVLKLSAKSYWSELPSAPEFVVMFLPSEGIYHAALQESPDLIEQGVGNKVLIATPTTLIALLQAVHYGWRQEKLAENAQRISEQGRVLHERLTTLFDHFGKLGAALGRATDSYNAAVGSFERKVKPAVRKLEELGAAGKKPVDDIDPVAVRPRELAAVDSADESSRGDTTGNES
jgi:DNA recombination protein RmuC